MLQNEQTEARRRTRHVRVTFAVKRISENCKSESHTESVAEQCARLKRVVEARFVHSQKHIIFSKNSFLSFYLRNFLYKSCKTTLI